eukprot:1386946-Amorphochlora_amoeboformis.AAC.1
MASSSLSSGGSGWGTIILLAYLMCPATALWRDAVDGLSRKPDDLVGFEEIRDRGIRRERADEG